MTFLETILTLSLLVVVPWAVWSAIDLVALHRDVRALGADLETESDLRRSLAGRHIDLMAHVGALEDSRSRTAPLDVPTVDEPEQPTTPTYRPVPPDFHTNR